MALDTETLLRIVKPLIADGIFRPGRVLEDLTAMYYLATEQNITQRRLAALMEESLSHHFSLGIVNRIVRRLKKQELIEIYQRTPIHAIYLVTPHGGEHMNILRTKIENELKEVRDLPQFVEAETLKY